MTSLAEKTVVVTGGSRGLGKAIAEQFENAGARVVIVARDETRLQSVANSIHASYVAGDITDPALAHQVITEFKPDYLVLNAGVLGSMKPIHETSWDEFSATWETDVKATHLWCAEAMKGAMPAGAQILIMSSGAAIGGSPLSGGYAGAKRMQWMLAGYFRGECARAGIDLNFKTLLPKRQFGNTEIGHMASSAYARRNGITKEQFLENFGPELSMQTFGDSIVEMLTSERYVDAYTVTITGNGMEILEAA